ncbi:MAG: hypothetical protein WAO76_08750 [Georgfuchsia sp.]
MSNEDPTSWMYSKSVDDFGVVTDADDYFHPLDSNPPGANVTETYFFAFSVPEERIHSFLYLTMRPNLGVLGGGVHVFQGHKSHYLASECYNWLDNLDTSHINRDNGTVTLPSGFVLKINKPFHEHELSFEDKYADNRFHLFQRAAMPPAVRGGNKHIEQNMKVEGELVLRGKKYRVDCYSVRDRSWGEHRPEAPMHVSPYTWITVGSADFAMNIASFDDMSQYPEQDGSIIIPPRLLTDGWVYRDKALTRIVSCTRKTIRSDQLVPQEHIIEATDKLGRNYKLHGKTVASSLVVARKNALLQHALMKWDVNGVARWGESQDLHWNDFERQFRK